MKMMKRIACMLLALMMILSMTFAYAESAPQTGSITINGVSEKTTYEIYKLLDLLSYNVAGGNYSYKVNADWAGFFATDDAKAYFQVDNDGYVNWIAAEDDDTVAAFAKKALAYAKSNNIAPVQSSKNEGEFVITGTSGTFSNLKLGYYLVDSTMGALCGLTTTNPNASINAKNGIPTIDKQVKEDSTNQWADANTADIGQIVEFRVTINVHAGAENYVLHDEMSAGLSFRGVTGIQHVIPEVSSQTVPAEYYTVVTTKGENGIKDDCTFEVRFTNDFTEHLETNDKVIITYTAMLNRNAVVTDDGNPNEAWLDFGEGNHTTHDTTTTKTFSIEIVKTDDQNKPLDGAAFRIYDAATGGNEVGVVPLMESDDVTPVLDEKGNPMYRRARPDETNTVDIVVKDGMVTVVGFDNGTYYLEEVTTPEGYNPLTARQKFIISDKNLEATFNNGIFSTGSGVHVVNKTGTMLPETGGIGTTLFYVIGGALAVAAVVLLVTKKRMNSME